MTLGIPGTHSRVYSLHFVLLLNVHLLFLFSLIEGQTINRNDTRLYCGGQCHLNSALLKSKSTSNT